MRRHYFREELDDDIARCWLFWCNTTSSLLRATAAIAVARLSHRNSVYPSVRHTGGSVKNGAS